jgi:hypothetical protein
MEMADRLSSTKRMGIIRKAKLAKVNSTGHYIFSGQKSAGHPTATCSAIDQRASSLANNRKFFGTYQKQ